MTFHENAEDVGRKSSQKILRLNAGRDSMHQSDCEFATNLSPHSQWQKPHRRADRADAKTGFTCQSFILSSRLFSLCYFSPSLSLITFPGPPKFFWTLHRDPLVFGLTLFQVLPEPCRPTSLHKPWPSPPLNQAQPVSSPGYWRHGISRPDSAIASATCTHWDDILVEAR